MPQGIWNYMKYTILALVAIILLSGCTRKETVYNATVEGPPIITETSVTEKEPAENHTANTSTRWGKTKLSVFLDEEGLFEMDATGQELIDRFKEAAKMLSESTKNKLLFEFVKDIEDSDIYVKWTNSLPADSLDAIGHTELNFSVGRQFNTIGKAEIQLLMSKDGKPIRGRTALLLSLHEIGHAIGMNHSSKKNSIMHPQLQEEVVGMSAEDIGDVMEMYKISPLPDLQFEKSSLVKRVVETGIFKHYLADVNFSVSNQGLEESGSFDFSISLGDRLIENNSTSLSDSQESASVGPGGIFTVIYHNISSRSDFFNVTIIVDEKNLIKELNETNNLRIIKI